MNKNLLIWGTAVVLIVIAVYVTKTNNNTIIPGIEQSRVESLTTKPNLDSKSTKATDFKLINLEGEQVSLSDFKGKNIFVNFFATRCPPCVGEMPEIQKIHEKYKDKDLVVLAVDLSEDKKVVKNFIDKNNYTFPVLLDLDGAVGDNYNTSSIPVSVFIDKNGDVVARQVGAMREVDMERYVKLLMDKQER